MSNYTSKREVLTPSAGSIAFSTLALLIAIAFTVIPRLGGDVLLRLLLGTDANIDLITSSQDDYGPVVQQVLSNDLLGRVVVFGIWMFIGLCAFILIMTFAKVFSTIEEGKKELSYVHQKRAKLLRDDLTTVAFKILIAALWAGFAILSLRFVLGYFAVTGYLVWTVSSTGDWLRFLLACTSLFIIIHVQIVFARLVIGKTRLWESDDN